MSKLNNARKVEEAVSRANKANPDCEIGTIVTQNSDGTVDVGMAHGDGTNAFPETVKKRVPCLSVAMWRACQPDTSVIIGYVKGNRQLPVVVGINNASTGRTTIVDDRVEITLLPEGLPLTGIQWEMWGRNYHRQRNSGYDDLIWKFRQSGEIAHVPYPLARAPVVGPPRVFCNRIIFVVGGTESDGRITGKVGTPIPPNRFGETWVDSQPNPFKIRICHVNCSQGSEDGALGLPGNGIPYDFEKNLHMWDIELSDATGLTWHSDGVNNVLSPVDMLLSEYVQRDVVFLDPDLDSYPFTHMFEERVWVTIIWAAAPEGAGSGPGRKWSFGTGAENPPQYRADNTSDRFFTSRHLINVRRSYTVAADDSPIRVTTSPLYINKDIVEEGSFHTDGLSKILYIWGEDPLTPGTFRYFNMDDPEKEVLNNYIELHDKPEGFTKWVEEIPYAPITLINKGEQPAFITHPDDVESDHIYIICARTADELSISDTVSNRIHELRLITLRATDGTQLSDSALPMDTPFPVWDVNSEDDFFNSPSEGIAGVPWFDSGFRFGDTYVNGYGPVYHGGYLENILFHRTEDAIYAIPKWSETPQIPIWKITLSSGSVSLQANLQGWTSFPSSYRNFTVCGIFNVGTDETPSWKVLIHFEERTTQTATNVFIEQNDLVGMFNYEGGIGAVPPTPGTDGYFAPQEWARPGHYTAWEVDEDEFSEEGGDTSSMEMAEIMDHAVNYWVGRNDPDGWENGNTDYCREKLLHGFMLMDPTTGTITTTEYIKINDINIGHPSGVLESAWYKSAFVGRNTDPRDVPDEYGNVIYSDPLSGIGNSLNALGFVPPLPEGKFPLFKKTWSVRRYWGIEEPEEYGPLHFAYLRASPGFIYDDSVWGLEGLVIDMEGHHEDYENGSGPRGNWDHVDWGRYFYHWRLWCTETTLPAQLSEEIPFSPTRCAFYRDIAVFLMQNKGWEPTL